MANTKSIYDQLKKLNFNITFWNRGEVRELEHILHEGEDISECVTGFYEGGIALLVATEMRLLLIDKKPFFYLNVEDLRFDMINEIDYNHRMMGANITISTGGKTLEFKSYNQQRLRHLITLVQQHMSSNKKSPTEHAEGQKAHLEEINKQLQQYLMLQHQQLQQMQAASNQMTQTANSQAETQAAQAGAMPKPSPQLSDYLFAQRLLEEFNQGQPVQQSPTTQQQAPPQAEIAPAPTASAQYSDMVNDAQAEIFGKAYKSAATSEQPAPKPEPKPRGTHNLEISALSIAYAKLPMAMRNRKFARTTGSRRPAAAAE